MVSFFRDWNANVGSQDIPEVTGKFGLGVQNAVLQCNLKSDRMISVSKANHSVSQ